MSVHIAMPSFSGTALIASKSKHRDTVHLSVSGGIGPHFTMKCTDARALRDSLNTVLDDAATEAVDDTDALWALASSPPAPLIH